MISKRTDRDQRVGLWNSIRNCPFLAIREENARTVPARDEQQQAQSCRGLD